MKKITKCILAVAICVIALTTLVSCKSDEVEDFYCNQQYIKYDANASEVICFNLTFFTKEKIESIKLQDMVGENITTNDYEVNILNNSVEELEDYQYRGLYTSVWMFEMKPNKEVDYCELQQINLVINGEVKEIVFRDPIKNVFQGGNTLSDVFLGMNLPNGFSSRFYNNTNNTAMYLFEVQEDITLESIECKSILTPKIVSVKIGSNVIENVSFPISLQKGQHVEIELCFEGEDEINQFYDVATNLEFNYIYHDKIQKSELFLQFDAIYPIQNGNLIHINEYIDRMIQDNKM